MVNFFQQKYEKQNVRVYEFKDGAALSISLIDEMW